MWEGEGGRRGRDMKIYDEMSDGLKNVNYHFIDMLFKQETKKASENTEGIVWYEQIYG